MSKAFTKDDASDAPVVVVPRAPLPPGTPNYVTPRGLAALRAELDALQAERARLEVPSEDNDARVRALTTVHARIGELAERIAAALLVNPREQPHDEVRFGARVAARTENGTTREWQIVGVDESDVAHGRVAFTAPLARALLGRRVGDAVTVRTPRGEEELEIEAIAYED